MKIAFLILLAATVSWAEDSREQVWTQWLARYRASEALQFATATQMAGNGLEQAGRLFIGFESGKPVSLARVCENEQCLELEIGESTASIKNNLVSKPLDFEGRLFTEFPAQEIKTEEVSSFWISGFIRPDGSSWWFIHDLNRKNIDQLRSVEMFAFNPQMIFAGTYFKDPDNGATIGRVEFVRDGKTYVVPVGKTGSEYSNIMLHFRDNTSDVSTYGGGRFLGIRTEGPVQDVKDGTKFEVNFNYAYNPPCARSPAYTCPVAKAKLDFAVDAGELSNNLK